MASLLMWLQPLSFFLSSLSVSDVESSAISQSSSLHRLSPGIYRRFGLAKVEDNVLFGGL